MLTSYEFSLKYFLLSFLGVKINNLQKFVVKY